MVERVLTRRHDGRDRLDTWDVGRHVFWGATERIATVMAYEENI